MNVAVSINFYMCMITVIDSDGILNIDQQIKLGVLTHIILSSRVGKPSFCWAI